MEEESGGLKGLDIDIHKLKQDLGNIQIFLESYEVFWCCYKSGYLCLTLKGKVQISIRTLPQRSRQHFSVKINELLNEDLNCVSIFTI